MDLSVIIVSFNVKNYLLNCIRSVYQAAGSYSLEVIVVDNGSEDNSVTFVREAFPQVILIPNLINAGFGTACNQGLEAAKGKYILFLNPDTLVGETVFSELIPSMDKDKTTGLMGCRILNEDGTLQLACRRSFPTPWVAFTRLTGLSALFPHSPLLARYNLTFLDEHQFNDVDAVSGSFMLCRREVLEKLGGFDESFFMYGEDLDLCYRVKEAGFRVVYNPAASIIHFKGKSKSDRVDTKFYFYESMKIFSRKHGKRDGLLVIFLNLAISIRYVFAQFRHLSTPVFSFIADFVLTAIAFETISYFRFGHFFYYPEAAYPIIYLFIFFVQAAVYNWFGVYRSGTGIKRRLIAAAVLTWVVLSLGAFFSKDFAFSRIVMLSAIVSIPLLQISWRILLQLFRNESKGRRALVITGQDQFYPTDWFVLWIEFHQKMTINGVLFKPSITGKTSYKNKGLWSELSVSFLKDHITDLILDTDSLSYKEQVQFIQLCREMKVRPHLIPAGSLKELVLNDILTGEEKTGFVSRLTKRLGDWMLGFQFKVRNDDSEPKKYLTGVEPGGKRSPVFQSVITIQSRFPGLSSEEDRQILTLFYNRFHDYQLDKMLVHDFSKRNLK
ncbi:MAG: glycosyltransferase [Bacteroidetes bacterium]|nr:glycosyltransferase [Bacteroidota bacterium]